MDVLEAMKKEMIRRRLSHRTVMTYIFYVKKFLLFCHKDPNAFSKKDCKEFLEKFMNKEFLWMNLHRKKNEDVSGSSLNVALNALKFMMEEVLRKSMKLNIRYSKTPKSLPTCLTKDEVLRIINSINNHKHKLIISLMYGAGLRVSEVTKLKSDDIQLEEEIGWVRHGKGDKDRPFIIPKCLKEDIERIIAQGRTYLFYGNKNNHISSRSIQVIIKKASKKTKIDKNVHPHTLRHSFATHVLEAGADIVVVQSLLGHNESRTTMEYLHVVRPKLLSVKSPLDG